jgi:hypothetical protein
VRVVEAEERYARRGVPLLKAHLLLIDSFQIFWIETIRAAIAGSQAAPAKGATQYYGATLREHLMVFKRFRACELLAEHGYPLPAFGLTRDLIEQALLMAAIANKTTTYRAVHGLATVEPGQDATPESRRAGMRALTKARKNEQRKALDAVVGKSSGLTQATRTELDAWTSMFDVEVHGSRATAIEIEAAFGKKAGFETALTPHPDKRWIAMYLNRSEEAAWMWLRLMPVLQPVPGAFGQEWADRWRILDESIRFQVDGNLVQLGKRIGPAFMELMDRKFAFDPAFAYVE